MSDEHQQLLLKLARLRVMVDQATLTPWRYQETKDAWSLFGEAREFKGKLRGGNVPTMQILKAPKHGMMFAEYWPSAADGRLIYEAVNSFPFFLDWAEDVVGRHHPVVCGCKTTHFLCAEHRTHNWGACPEIKALVRALDRLHIENEPLEKQED